MKNGKKTKAEHLFFDTLTMFKYSPLTLFLKAINNTKPLAQIQSIRKGGASYQVPVPIKEKRSIFLAMKSLVKASRKKRGTKSSENLLLILSDAAMFKGDCVKNREIVENTSIKNRSLAHYRWF